MTKNNVTSIKYQTLQPTDSITLESVQDAMTIWRKNKKTRGEKIPEHMWDMVICLLKTNQFFTKYYFYLVLDIIIYTVSLVSG